MPQVSVKDCAQFDARLLLAGRSLRLHHERLGWRLIRIWSQATARNSPIIPASLVGAALGKNAADVARAFIDAQLAEPVDGENLDLSPLESMFGDCNWLHDKRATASAGGQVRAATAERAPNGTFLHAMGGTRERPLRDRIIEQLGIEPRSRTQLRGVLGCRKDNMLAAARELLADGVVFDKGGVLFLAHAATATVPGTGNPEPVPGTDREPGTGNPEPVPGTDREPGTGNPEPVPGTDREPGTGNPEPVPGTDPEPSSRQRFPEPSSALALAPALAPAHTRAREGTGNREPEPTPESNPLDSQKLVPPENRRTVAQLLWSYQNQCRADIAPDAPAVPLNAAPGGPLDAVILLLAHHTPQQCRHALDMFKLEARHLRDAGTNPLQYLNGFTNWKSEPFGRRVGTTPAAVAQEARDRRARSGKSSTAQEEPPPRRNRVN